MFKIFNKFILVYFPSVLLLIVFSLFFGKVAHAATLSLMPTSSSISVGNIVSIKVVVNTSGKYINNGEASIQFPTDLLEVVSISKNSSIFSLWVEEPSFSNYNGKISFNGGVPTPGFIGSNGTIASVTFKAKKAGTASVIFGDAAIRENDGFGTDILTSKNSGIIQIGAVKEIEIPPKNIPENNTNENIPIKSFTPSIRFKDVQGIIKLSDEKYFTNVDYFTIQLDDNTNFKVKKDQLVNYEYYLPVLNEGNHEVVIVTFDKIGKYIEHTLNFTSPSLIAPKLSTDRQEITDGEFVTILGKTSYVNREVEVILESKGKELYRYTQISSSDGSFSIVTDKINTIGSVSISARVNFSETVKSLISEKIYVKVNETKFIEITRVIFWLIVIIILLIILLFILYLGWHKFFSLKRKIDKDLEDTRGEVHKAMILLREELGNQLEILEKVKEDRALNNKEEKIFKELEKNIDDIEDFIEKKIKKIM